MAGYVYDPLPGAQSIGNISAGTSPLPEAIMGRSSVEANQRVITRVADPLEAGQKQSSRAEH